MPDQTIHPYNKNESLIRNEPYFQVIQQRKNAIVMGDQLDDAYMVKGLPHEAVIKIGFFNEGSEKELKKYEETFDVVILNDGSFEPFLTWFKENAFEKR